MRWKFFYSAVDIKIMKRIMVGPGKFPTTFFLVISAPKISDDLLFSHLLQMLLSAENQETFLSNLFPHKMTGPLQMAGPLTLPLYRLKLGKMQKITCLTQKNHTFYHFNPAGPKCKHLNAFECKPLNEIRI